MPPIRSSSQKFLLVVSIIDIVGGAFVIIAGLMTGILGAGVGISGAQAGLTSSQAATAAGGLTLITVLAFLSGGFDLVEGILGLRAANDNQKIMPVWILSIVSLVIIVIEIIMSLFQGGFSFTYILSLIISGLMFWIANNIKQEAHL